jgi:hypothetical protein
LLGGLARRATFIEGLRHEWKNVILVDTGDLLYSRFPNSSPKEKEMGELRADLFMKTYNLMGYDAFTPGEFDLFFGVENLVKMSRQANFPFLAANLLNSKTKKPVFKPYIIKEVQGVKVGLLGLISNRQPLGMGGPPGEKEKFRLADPIETAQKILPRLKKKCKLIVALVHMDADEQQMLAKACPDIFFILSGHNPHYQQNPIRANNSQIFIAGSRGEYLGQVDFLIEGRNLYARYQLISLTAKYADHPQTQEWVNQYKAKLENLSQTLPPAGSEGGPLVVRPGLEGSAPLGFLGEKVCLPCHPNQHQSWLQTPHARAFQTLVQHNQSSDPACLGCHTTGYQGLKKDPAASLENVQCEACHGPGDGHPEPRKNLSQISETQCRQCHDSANSPKFDYPTYLEKIRHSKSRNDETKK